MAYIVNKSDGTVLTSVAPGTIDNSYGGLILIGKLYSGYGEALNENLVRLLENSAKTTAPTNPLLGQLWFDSANKILKVCTSGGNVPTFKNVSGCITSSTTPADPVNGDLWWNTTAKQLSVYDSATSSFIVIGPSSSSATGQTGAIVATMNDSSLLPHYVIKEYSGDEVVAIVSKDAFTPAGTEPTNTNFPAIYAGYTLSNAVGYKFVGTATNADKLENNYANAFIKANTAVTTNGTVAFTNVDGITIGGSSDLKVSVTASGNASVTNQTASGLLSLKVKKGATTYELIKLDPTPATPTAVISSLSVDGDSKFIGSILPNVTGTYNLGNTTTAFETLYINNIRSVSSGNIALGSNTMPTANNTIELGNSTFRFKSLYVTTLDAISATFNNTNLEAPNIANANIVTSVLSNCQIITANSITMGGSIIPNANTYTIGNSVRVFNTVFATNFGTAGTPITLAYVNNVTPGTGSNIVLGGHATPSANVTYSLGTASLRFVNIFTSNINSIGANFTSGMIVGGDILTSGSNATVNIGSASGYFGNIYGTAMLARYADLAERYHADAEYDSGTVVKLGGPHEITQTVTSGDTSVFGVISTDPGLILNAGAGNDETHPLIALTGRVPCKVTGTVNKGDRLVSSDIPGVARAFSTGDDVLAIIGRSLVNKTSTEVELIEIVVGVK